MPPKRAFVALQDRFVSSLAVSCCPTMDLIAVLTLDHHLLVHRTTSWQKLMHIKPSDVGFKMVTLAWKPDGLQLAVGCDEGDVAIFEIESGEILPNRSSSFRHEHCITAIHWTQINEIGVSDASSNNSRCRQKVSGASGAWNTLEPMSQSKIQFHHRSSRFLNGYRGVKMGEIDTVLVTADERGFIAMWWMGRVLLTRIDVSKQFTEEEFGIMESLGHQWSDTSTAFRIERVHVAPDLSLLFVLLAFSCGGGVDNAMDGQAGTRVHRMLTLDLTTIQHIHEEVALVARTVDCVDTILSRIATAGKQMATEWKNATRIFELKMGLIGSLYEKYACEDPPQVDMLSVVVTGITSPALAQYFAQDIQEMSVHRMQKALYNGFDSLQTLADEKVKRDLVDVSFLLSELRGHATWNTNAYATTMGIAVSALDDLVQIVQDALVAVEALTLALHETRQDFALLFQWILERIRIHTNSSRPGGGTGAAGSGVRDAAGAGNGLKSLLNLRRLCDFLQRAAESAQRFRKLQPSHNIYKVETTFGNPVSLQLATLPTPTIHDEREPAVGCLALIKRIQDQWSVLLSAMTGAIAQAIEREKSGCFTIGTCNSNIVEECHIHFRQPFAWISDGTDGDHSDNEEDDAEAINWSSLKHYGPIRDEQDSRSTILIGFRLQSGVLLLLRACQDVSSPQFRLGSSSRLTWDSAIVGFSEGPDSTPVVCRGFDFYGDATTNKSERLAFVLDRVGDGQVHQEWLCLQSYDNIAFSRPNPATSFKATLVQGPTHTFRLDQSRGRAVGLIAQPSKSTASVIATASRGVLCVVLPPNRLTVFDAEDSEDDDDEEDDDEGDEGE